MSDSAALTELDSAIARLLRDLDIRRTAPVPVEQVASALGLPVVKTPGAAEGRLCLRSGRATIEVNEWGPVSRRRFTLAHELGHAYLLHPDRALSWATCTRWPSPEAFCNDFAASLLLPRAWLMSEVSSEASLLELLRLAQTSRVSPMACSIRLLRTGIWTSGLLSWLTRHNSWRLGGAAGLSVAARRSAELTPASAKRLGNLRGASGHPRIQISVTVATGQVRVLDAEVSVGVHQCLALVPLRRSGSAWAL